MAGLSPMMLQYMDLKNQYQDCILFYRLGDFYEMFFDDALLASKELELTLTGRECGLKERAPMCGVPYHSSATYIAKLIERGYKVAICEQMSDPAMSKGLVIRDVVRIVTPGTVVDPAMLDEKSSSYVLCVVFEKKRALLAYADVSTGELIVHQVLDAARDLRDELIRISANEIVTNDETALNAYLAIQTSVTTIDARYCKPKQANECLFAHFRVQSLCALGLEERDKRGTAAGALLHYLTQTQKNDLSHITKVTPYQGATTMFLDRATRRNLELTQSLRYMERKGSLLWLLDQTNTAMGARLLKSWVENPLIDAKRIQTRLDGVDAFLSDMLASSEIKEQLQNVSDMERLLSKISYGSLNGRDCLALLHSLQAVEPIKRLLMSFDEPSIQALGHTMTPLASLCEWLEQALHPEPPITITEGGLIKDGYHSELDDYRNAEGNAKQWLLDMECAEREATGIKTLKIHYNRVFGYYLEVSKSYLGAVPLRYTRKQTLANAERFTTPELHDIEQKITNAKQLAIQLESTLFDQIRNAIRDEIPAIQQNALSLKTVDALLSLADVARENGYVKPTINEEGIFHIVQGRHPIVEKMLSDGEFVPNDVLMDLQENRMLIITGPNMAGKSTYMRQVALIALLAQMGSFVPATSADISICDRVFTRIGASDDLASGQSTFMVEMTEAAGILRSATSKSLVILDEIGRGTSTFDGLAIAWAMVEHLLNPKKIGAKTLFATHYHELSEMESKFEGVKNYSISAVEHGEEVIFLRKILRGGADKSYGVHVAHLAGVPAPVISRAREIMARLAVSDINQEAISQNILGHKKEDKQTDLFHLGQDDLIEELQNMDVMSMTPMEALNLLFTLREKARKL